MPNKPRDREADVERDDDDDEVEEFEGDETIVMSSDDDDDDDLDVSMEVNVEKLMAEMEKTKADDIERKKEIRRRLEEIQEQRSLEDTYSFDMYADD